MGEQTSPTSREACDAIIAANDAARDKAGTWVHGTYYLTGELVTNIVRPGAPERAGVIANFGFLSNVALAVAAVNAAPALADRVNAVRTLAEERGCTCGLPICLPCSIVAIINAPTEVAR